MHRIARAACVLAVVALAGCLNGELTTGFRSDSGAGDEPDAATATNQGQESASVCGDGLIDGSETCEGACPVQCNDNNTCTSDLFFGDPDQCNSECSFIDITECVSDGCCPDNCDASTDPDCSNTCGDGIVDEAETCDGNCPSACDDGNACTTSRITGRPDRCNVQCSTTPVTACVDADGCCPMGCLATTDSDCGAVCGNGVIEGVEICDGDCPQTCDDTLACTTDRLMGSAATCNARCSNVTITQCVGGDGCCPSTCNQLNDTDCPAECGNDVVEMGETCDGACPSCDDNVACTADVMSGSAGTCNVTCSNTPITQCVDGDGCCAPGCDTTNDTDCNAVCGNGVVEGGETCDPVAACPTACNDSNACTADQLVGSAQTCDAVCRYTAITACTSGDGCCPNGCNANNDDDCAPVCGNDIVEAGETCDPVADCPTACNDADDCTTDVLNGSAAACTAACSYNTVTACTGGDNCCPTGCTNAMDSDCPLVIDCTVPSSWPSGWVTLENAIFAETNARRTSPQTCNGTGYPAAPALVVDSRLRQAARCHALDMASNNFFSHVGSNGSTFDMRVDLTGYNWNALGENIAAGNNTAVAIVNQWMNSTSGHCESIMNPNYEDLGIGYAYDASATDDHYSVQVFGREP